MVETEFMLRNMLLKELWDQRKPFLWWCLGFLVLIPVIISMYPSVRDMTEINIMMDNDLIRAFSGGVTDITSPVGYLNSQLYFLMVPLLFLIFGITQGSGAIAGEEESGTLDLLLSNPVSRSRVVLQKFSAIIVNMLVFACIVWLISITSVIAINMEISLIRIGEITFSVALLGILFASLAFLVGCVIGKRGMSVGITSAIGVLTYILYSLGPIVDRLEPLEVLSPFYYYFEADPLTNGLYLPHVLVLIIVILVLVVIAYAMFKHRDLGV
jgi:ABC-2 type transport system permease protein